MEQLYEARFYETLPEGDVRCTLCSHDCRIREGGRGACAVRFNHEGKLYTLVYDKVAARHVDPIEKKPLFHFLPGSISYSISTVGCDLRCAFCQNWEISQWPKEYLPKRIGSAEGGEPLEGICPQLAALEQSIPGEQVTPHEIVAAALAVGATSIAYTYTEPTIFLKEAGSVARPIAISAIHY